MNGRERGKLLAEQIMADYEARAEDRRPNRLRPSELGHECSRYLWYRFRWADTFETFEGRMLRLFETGHIQEDRMVADLRRTGAVIYAKDPDNPKEQIGVALMDGHSKGYLDGVGEGVPHAKADHIVIECKSHSEKSFADLKKNGVQISKEQHYAQMQLYMHLMELPEALYISVNKNTDEVYCEFVDYDEKYAARLVDKAERVIFNVDVPPRINNNGTYFKCKFCSAHPVCHQGAPPPRSCRTCVSADPLRNTDGEPTWYCTLFDTTLDLNAQRAGCADHRYHPDMLSNKSLNTEASNPEEGVFVYVDGFGEVWEDEGPSGDKKQAAE